MLCLCTARVVCINGKHPRSEVLFTPHPTPAPVFTTFSLSSLRCLKFGSLLTRALGILLKFFTPVCRYMRFTFRLASRRSYSSSYDCDPYIISSGSLLGSGDSWTAECANYPGNNSQCNSVIIGSTGFRCTDYSSSEDWSMGENNFTHTFSSIHDKWIVR